MVGILLTRDNIHTVVSKHAKFDAYMIHIIHLVQTGFES